MSESDVIELLREANVIQVEDLPDPHESASAQRLLASILEPAPIMPLRPTSEGKAARGGILRRRLAFAFVLVAFAGIVVSPLGLHGVAAAVDEISSWFGGSGAIIDAESGAPVGSFDANGIVTSATSDGEGGWFVSGGFTLIDGTPRAHLAHIRSDGSLDPDWQPTLSAPRPDNYTYATLASGAGRVYVAGPFEEINGQRVGNVAALDASDGALVPGWQAHVQALDGITSLALSGSRLYLGLDGPARVGGESRYCVLALDQSNGALDATFAPKIDWVGDLPCISTLATAGGRLYLGGVFTSVGGQSSQGLVAVDAATGAPDPSFRAPELRCDHCPVARPTISALAASSERVYVAGEYTSVAGLSRDGLSALDARTGTLDRDWNPRLAVGSVLKLELVGSQLYAGGSFTAVDDHPRRALAVFDAQTGELLPSWAPPTTTQYILALALSERAVFAGGAEEQPSR